MKQNVFESILAVIGTALTYIFGGWDVALITLVIFMGLDYVSGVMIGAKNKKIDSEISYSGLKRKLMIIFILIAAVALDRLIGNEQWVFRTAVCWFYIGNEGISLFENAGKLGMPYPQKVLEMFTQLKDKGNSESK